jgi:peptidoglycan/xylan/chitin deacetylase (PgdA/CDA1 family)
MLTVVSYHHFAATEDIWTAGLGVTTDPERFQAHLEWFTSQYQPVSLDRVLAGDLPRRALLITIDDAYRSVADVAVPMLAEMRLPAVLFTNPRVLAGGYTPLDTLLALAFNSLGGPAVAQALGLALPMPLPAIVQQLLPGQSVAGREEWRQRLLRKLGMNEHDLAAQRWFLTAADVAGMAARGLAIGNHTASHVHGRALEPSDFAVEIDGSKTALEAMCGRPVTAFSFPYGNEQDATPALLARLRATGHRAQFLVQARSNSERPAPDVFYRTNLRNQRPVELPLRLDLLPGIRSLKAQLRARAAAGYGGLTRDRTGFRRGLS